jgi:hypothetical protein
MQTLHLGNQDKVEVIRTAEGLLVKSAAWIYEKQIDGYNKMCDILDNLSEEELNVLPDGLMFEKEYRIKWRDTSDIDRKLDEML